MHRYRSRAGFTLIELMVVIAIIGVLVAILFPVFSSAREKARQTKCQTQLMQLVTALNEFHADKGYYPLAPQYNDPPGRYEGGFSALYPDYVTDRDLFICPDDREALQNLGDCHDRVYCSYNGLIDWDDVNSDSNTWEFLPLTSLGQAILYNYYGYTYSCQLLTDGDEECGHPGYSSAYDVGPAYNITPARIQGVDTPDLSWLDTVADIPIPIPLPDFLHAAGLSWQHFPRLANIGAPDYTIVTHCPNHRRYFGDSAQEMDVIVTLGGQTSLVNITNLGYPTVTGVPAGAPSAVAGWVHQNFP